MITPTDQAAYVKQLKQLLPPGALWNLEQDSVLTASLEAIAEELARIGGRGVDLINESDPRTAEETIGDWERILGLPDELVTEIPGAVGDRRIVVVQKLLSRTGQNYNFFFLLCAAAGYPLVSIELFAESVLRAGFRVSDRVYGDVYAYTMHVTLDPRDAAALSSDELERVVRHATHSHIQVMFTFN